MTLQEKILATNSLNNELEELTKQKEELEQKILDTQAMKDNYLVEILSELKTLNKKEEQVGDVFATLFSREDITWLDDAALLKRLQDNKANEFIKVTVKTTTSIDKNALKKAFKVDEALKEKYKEFYGTKLTEYVVVNAGEVHQKMLEHIEESKSSK